MSNLTVRPEGQTTAAQIKSDWGEFAETKVSIRCDVGQPTSRGGKKIGLFNFSSTFEPVAELRDVVLLYPGKNRVLFGKEMDGPRRCGSDNYHQPSSLIRDPISRSCGDCFASKWDSAMTDQEMSLKRALEKELNRKEGVAPVCTETINLIVWDHRKVPFSLKFQKTQLKIVQDSLISFLKFSGRRPFETKFDIGLKEHENRSGKWFEYVFHNFTPLSSEESNEARFYFEAFKLRGEEALAQQHAEMDAEKEVGYERDPVAPSFDDTEQIPF